MSDTLTETLATETVATEISPALPLAHVNLYTNQQLIDAFFTAANQLDTGINNGDYQALIERAGLDINQLAADRNGSYVGLPLAQLPNLSTTEREQIHQGLLKQLQRTSKPGRVTAPDGLNLRIGPGTDQTIIVSLPVDSDIAILGESGEWLLATAGEQTGWLFASLVDRNPSSSTGNTGLTATQFTGPLAPTDPLHIPTNATWHMTRAAETWDQYGALIQHECARLNFEPAVAVAILGVESTGRAFENNRMVIRFENHIFLHYWGQTHRDLFDSHFTGSPNGNEHRWRKDANGEWLACHTSQATEWQTFELARSFDERAAMYSISMGAAQTMGFNHLSMGYNTVQAMFDAFQTDVRNQLAALFRFIEVNRLLDAVRAADFKTFARTYNGRGQEDVYSERMRSYYDAFRQLLAANNRGEAVGRLPHPSTPTLLNADPELLAAWRKHIANGFANNETMFQGLLQGFLRPYWTTVWMYRILFGLGVASFLLAAALAIFTGRSTSVFTFGGLSAISLLGYFFNRPLQALEQNLQFLTWLGIVYNTYWTRLTLLNDERTVQSDITDVTDEAINRIKELVAEHAKYSKSQQSLRLPQGGNHE